MTNFEEGFLYPVSEIKKHITFDLNKSHNDGIICNEYGINVHGEHFLSLYDYNEKNLVSFVFISDILDGRQYKCIYSNCSGRWTSNKKISF